MKNLSDIKMTLQYRPVRSAWYRGVKEYAAELLDSLIYGVNDGYIDIDDALSNHGMFHKALLNGANTWHEFSWGGCSLIYDYQIAKRLCTPSELKRTMDGYRKPNKYEEWLDVQARALDQAEFMLWNLIKEV